MVNGNKVTVWTVIKFLFVSILIPILIYMGNVVWTNDKDSRERDEENKEEVHEELKEIRKDHAEKSEEIRREQYQQTQQILVAIAKLETKLED